MSYEYKQSYRRKLPHLHSPGATLFVTFRLADTIPKNVITKWKSEEIWIAQEFRRVDKLVTENAEEINKRHKERITEYYRNWFAKFEDVLHKEETGPVWLKKPQIADIIADSLQYRDSKVYRLDAYCNMSNHVHFVFAPFLNDKSLKEIQGSNPLRYESDEPTLSIIMQSLKRHTAREANKILNRTGSFWEAESYDHEVRGDREMERIINYVLNNPVKADIVKDWREWKWCWKRNTN